MRQERCIHGHPPSVNRTFPFWLVELKSSAIPSGGARSGSLDGPGGELFDRGLPSVGRGGGNLLHRPSRLPARHARATSSRSGARRTRSSFVGRGWLAGLDGDMRTTMVGTDYAAIERASGCQTVTDARRTTGLPERGSRMCPMRRPSSSTTSPSAPPLVASDPVAGSLACLLCCPTSGRWPVR